MYFGVSNPHANVQLNQQNREKLHGNLLEAVHSAFGGITQQIKEREYWTKR